MPVTFSHINQLDQPTFTELLGPLYEESPWVAHRTWPKRPFSSPEHLLSALNQTLRLADPGLQMDLILAHPELAGRFANMEQLTASSQEEQASAGLTTLTCEQARSFASLNEVYKAKFTFPFIICAKLNNVDSILAACQSRLTNTPEQEFQTALAEIEKIAQIRLAKLLE